MFHRIPKSPILHKIQQNPIESPEILNHNESHIKDPIALSTIPKSPFNDLPDDAADEDDDDNGADSMNCKSWSAETEMEIDGSLDNQPYLINILLHLRHLDLLHCNLPFSS